MTTLEVLRGARAKIAQGWCQGASARDADGQLTGVTQPDACCWCAIGAVYAAAPLEPDSGDAAFEYLARVTPGHLIGTWNDDPSRTQAEVLALFDRAIAQQERAA